MASFFAGKARLSTNGQPRPSFWRGFTSDGVVVGPRKEDFPANVIAVEPLVRASLDGLLAQIEDEGMAVAIGCSLLLPWECVYDLIESADYPSFRDEFALPPDTAFVPVLQSFCTLVDKKFSIAIEGWRSPDDPRPVQLNLVGAIVEDGAHRRLLPRLQWQLSTQVSMFQSRTESERDPESNRRQWGRIRRLAISSHAILNRFLTGSVVVTPDKLTINLRSSEVGGTRVVEVLPGFAGAPEGWLAAFDKHSSVLNLYNLPTPDGGIVEVLITPQVKTVLESVKRMKGRRVAGARAEAFLVNPFAALGEAASETIDEEQFMESRAEAGLLFERFFAHIGRDEQGYPELVALSIETPKSATEIEREIRPFTDDGELADFIAKVDVAIAESCQLCGWKGYDFEIFGETKDELGYLRRALEDRTKPRVEITYASVFDLGTYYQRIEGIGEEESFYSPFIARKDDGLGWFPENVDLGISWTPDGDAKPVTVPVSLEMRAKLKAQIDEAAARGDDTIDVPGFDKPFNRDAAARLLNVLDEVDNDVRQRKFDPEKPRDADAPRPINRLVIKSNIQAIDYQEARRELLEETAHEPQLPRSLRSTVALMDHQFKGVGWLQQLFLKAPAHCRGAVLADDMGLGKTLQLLTLLAWAFERDLSLAPALVVAPVSLLENWASEADKFLVPATLPILVAYGDELANLRVPRQSVDEQLRQEGLVKFLKHGWRGDAKLVLTTYETLRDLEFSFAAVKWSVMVCDEAQRIKNPNAMTTRAAKKMNVDFRIACTGTPVENTLTDLWCLFDYVQPGLLGALNDFGQRYRRPIEAETSEEKARVEELRTLIKPQILRRTKKEVAKALKPRKDIKVPLQISPLQRNLYSQAVNLFKKRDEPGATSPFKNHLGLLHYIRQVCTDPREFGFGAFKPQPLDQYRVSSPKLAWLLDKLQEIKGMGKDRKGEKVIIFCEFRDIQRMLRYYIEEVFGFAPDIINGDTSASAKHVASRQKRIDAFQSQHGFGVIILSPLAVGFGVNIQAANHVVHYTRHWNPAKEDQATDRAYRIGQEKEVFVYCPIIEADNFITFDVKLDALLTFKRDLAQDMLNGSGDVGPNEFAIDDMAPPGERDGLSPKISIEDLEAMEPRYFEGFVAALWQKRVQGTVYVTPPHDGGIDVVAIDGRAGFVIQCKTSSRDGQELGWDAVKEVVAGQAAYARRHPGVAFAKVCVTNQFFNTNAREQARNNDVELVEKPEIEKLLAAYQVTKLDVEALLFTDWSKAS